MGFLVLMGMAAPASAIETKAIGGFILSAQACSLRETSARRTNTKKFCHHTTFVQMKIDGPMTNNYTATCQAFDRAGKLLGQQTAVMTRSKEAIMNNDRRDPRNDQRPANTGRHFELDVSFQQVAKVECQARRVP